MALNILSYIPQFYPSSHKNVPRSIAQSNVRMVVTCSASTQIPQPLTERRSANYQPTFWSFDFVQSLKTNNADAMCKDRAKTLEKEVRCMINQENGEFLTMLELIDDVQRLGLKYRFDEDINRALDKFFLSGGFNAVEEKSLHAAALSFRILRQHGYDVSQDVFNNFMDYKGDLAASYRNDVKGILSLYEASFLASDEEAILVEAKAQTETHLMKNLPICEALGVAESVSHALELPLHHRMHLLESRWYIEAYGKKDSSNPGLLELARLNFNMVQAVLQNDLKEMSRWWKELGLANKMSFSRDRLMECFFWAVGMASEPHFNICRKGLTKVASFITIIDDVYDVYGTLEELELFTDAVERWDVNAFRNLPDYMKLCFLAFYNTINEMAYDILKEHGQDFIPYLTKAWADMFRAFIQEAKWSHNKTTPAFEEYLENAWRSVSGTVLLTHTYLLLNQNISKESLDRLVNYPDLLHSPSVIFRLCNDLGTSSAELARGESINSISCYMNETGCSEEDAREHIHKLIEDAWKIMNKDHGKTGFPKLLEETAMNLARIAQCTYQHGDGHGAPDASSGSRIRSLLVEPISIMDPKLVADGDRI